ncbi:MAG: VWA domain-containing protein [Saprospiraceae bacterium]|nr:VWA domain-containing protein [Saprospiraceae bacterium]
MKKQAFETKSITESIVAFAQFVRSHGLNVGIQETQDALQSAQGPLLTHPVFFRSALKTIFCNSPEDRRLFDRLFGLFWDTNPVDLAVRKNKTTVQGTIENKANPSLVMLGRGKTDSEAEEGKNVSGANETERLKMTDFSKLSEIDAEHLGAIARKLFREMAIRLRRRRKEQRRNGPVNLRKTIRRSLSYGGEPIDLFRKAQRPKKQRLIVLLDASGSMDKYSFYLLRFVCALREHFRQLEAFVFSTSLIRISKLLQPNRLELVLAAISRQADNWSGGTKIGECLTTFSDQYGKQTLNGSPIVLVLSDGLDTGDPNLVGEALFTIQKRAKKVIWLNPLKGMKGYEPLAGGMQAALPWVDVFQSAHNLESLLELENILSDA